MFFGNDAQDSLKAEAFIEYTYAPGTGHVSEPLADENFYGGVRSDSLKYVADKGLITTVTVLYSNPKDAAQQHMDFDPWTQCRMRHAQKTGQNLPTSTCPPPNICPAAYTHSIGAPRVSASSLKRIHAALYTRDSFENRKKTRLAEKLRIPAAGGILGSYFLIALCQKQQNVVWHLRGGSSLSLIDRLRKPQVGASHSRQDPTVLDSK